MKRLQYLCFATKHILKLNVIDVQAGAVAGVAAGTGAGAVMDMAGVGAVAGVVAGVGAGASKDV